MSVNQFLLLSLSMQGLPFDVINHSYAIDLNFFKFTQLKLICECMHIHQLPRDFLD